MPCRRVAATRGHAAGFCPLIEINARRRMRCDPYAMIKVALLAAIFFAVLPAKAWTQDTGDAVAGRHVAESWCSACHVIGPGQASGTSNGAPPFAAVARMKATTPLSLSVFLQTPHGRMPDLHLSRDEIADVSAYIMSLRAP